MHRLRLTRQFSVGMLAAWLWLVTGALTPAWAAGLEQAMPHVQGTRKIVLEALDKLLAGDGNTQLLGQGSWLRPPQAAKPGGLSRNYADPLLGGTSDHDLRLVFQGEEREAAKQWMKTQNTLRQSIQNLFHGKGAAEIEETLLRYGFNKAETASLARQGGERISAKILNSVNLYPPNQLTRFIVDQRSAEVAFRRLGSVPNLGGTMVEGVWGAGQTARVQELEAAGRLFYRSSNGRVMAGFTDLVHMTEGYGRYSLGGSANMASQWADKALESLHERDPELLGKYLRRLKEELKIARNRGKLTGQAMSDSFRALDDMISKAGQGATVFEDKALRAVIRNAQSDAKLLGELARNPGVAERQLISGILGNAPGRWEKLVKQLRQVKDGVAEAVTFERVVNGVLIYMGTLHVSEKAGSQGLEAALRTAGAETALLVNIGPGIMMSLTNAILDSARDAGYALAVSAQDWDDFLAGISGTKGYQGETALNRNIEQLAQGMSQEAEVRNFVALQARHIAALKETGAPSEAEATRRSREEIEAALVRRMTPLITQRWYQTRKQYMEAYLDLALELDQQMDALVLTGNASPEPAYLESANANADASVTFSLRPQQDLKAIKDLLARMEAIIRPLGGTKREVYFNYKTDIEWRQGNDLRKVGNGSGLEPAGSQSYRFATPGVHEVVAAVKVTVQVHVGGDLDSAPDVFHAQPLLQREYTWQVPMQVHVASVQTVKAEPRKSARLQAPPEITASDIFKLRLALEDSGKKANKQPGKFKLILIEPGRTLTQADLMMLTYNVGAADRSLVSHPVQVLSSNVQDGVLEIEAQVDDIYDSVLSDSQALDLAFVHLDRAGSIEFELAKAMAEMEEAEAEMDRKFAAMTPEQQEKFMADMDAAIEEAERNPPPPPPDPEQEALAEGVVISQPVVLRPVELKLTTPAGWRETLDNRRWSKNIERVIDQPRIGARTHVHGSIDQQLSSGFLAGGDFAELQGKGKPFNVGDWQGWRKDQAPSSSFQAQDGVSPEAQRTYTASGMLALRKGQVYLTLRYHLKSTGFRRINDKKEVEYDTFEPAEKAFEGLQRDLAQTLGKVNVVTTGAANVAARSDTQADYAQGVRLVAAKTRLAPGEVIEIRAVLDGNKPAPTGLRYDWYGNHEGKGDAVRFFASEPGDYSIGVNLHSDGKVMGSASLRLEVR